MLGVPDSVTRTVASVESTMPAARFLEEGDQVVAVNGRPVAPEQISESIRGSGSDLIRLTVIRNGERRTFTATPVEEEVRVWMSPSTDSASRPCTNGRTRSRR